MLFSPLSADRLPGREPAVSLMESHRWVCAKEAGNLRTQGPGEEAAPQSTRRLSSQAPVS